MALSRKSIVKQLCHELAAWKELNIRATNILGEFDREDTLKRYRSLLQEDDVLFMPMASAHLTELGYEVEGRINAFYHYEKERLVAPPPTPYFCFTTLFRQTISQNMLLDVYEAENQAKLIQDNLLYMYPSSTGKMNGAYLAAMTGNHEMVEFLLRQEFTEKSSGKEAPLLDLSKETLPLLEAASKSTTEVRQVIFTTCGARLGDEISSDLMTSLIKKMKNMAEWRALYQVLSTTQRKALLKYSGGGDSDPCHWLTLITDAEQLKILEDLLTDNEQLAEVLDHLLRLETGIVNGHVILRLMSRMNLQDRMAYLIKISPDRVNALFTGTNSQPSFQDCLTVLGYTVTPKSVGLTHLYGSSAETPQLKDFMDKQLNLAIWNEPLFDNATKLNYFYVVQQALVANSDQRKAAFDEYKRCVDAQEKRLIQHHDGKRFIVWRWIRNLLRMVGIIRPFPITVHARELLRKVADVVASNPKFYAQILDLNTVILPGNNFSTVSVRKELLNYFAEKNYASFWSKMPDRESLLQNPSRFRQLLQRLYSDDGNYSAISGLIAGLGSKQLDNFVEVQQNSLLLTALTVHLEEPHLLPLNVLSENLGSVRMKALLKDPQRINKLLLQLPKKEDLLRPLLAQFPPPAYDEVRMCYDHFAAVLLATGSEHYKTLQESFNWLLPLPYSVAEIGKLLRELTQEQLSPFWNLFLTGRRFDAQEIIDFCNIIGMTQAPDKCREIVTLWMASTSPKSWSPEVMQLLPLMNDQQQAQAINAITDEQLCDMIRMKRLGFFGSVMLPANTLSLLNRAWSLLSTSSQLELFFSQLSPVDLKQLVNNAALGRLKTLTASQNFLQLVNALAFLDNDRWSVIAPKLFDLTTDFDPSDEWLTLLTQHVPATDREHVLTVLHQTTPALQRKLQGYLNSSVVRPLVNYNTMTYKAITLESVQGLPDGNLQFFANPAAEKAPYLVTLAEQLFRTLIVSRQKAMPALKESGFCNWIKTTIKPNTYTPEQINFIKKTAEELATQLQQIVSAYMELAQFNAISPSSQGIKALQVNYAGCVQWAQSLRGYIEELRKKDPKHQALLDLEAVHTTISEGCRAMAAAQAKLFADLPEAYVRDMLRNDDVTIVLEAAANDENHKLFLTRCRQFFIEATTAEDWIKQFEALSVSSRSVLFSNTPETKALFKVFDCETFLELVRAFVKLKPELWKAFVPQLLALREQFQTDLPQPLDNFLQSHLADEESQYHLLGEIRTAKKDQLTSLLDYLSSKSVGEAIKLKLINVADLKSANADQQKQKAIKSLADAALTIEKRLNESVTKLKDFLLESEDETEKGSLLKALVSKITYNVYIFFGQTTVGDTVAIRTSFSDTKTLLDQISVDCTTLLQLNSICLFNPEWHRDLYPALHALSKGLETFADSEAGKRAWGLNKEKLFSYDINGNDRALYTAEEAFKQLQAHLTEVMQKIDSKTPSSAANLHPAEMHRDSDIPSLVAAH